jgi:Gluconate 2-dehydrogenase subunit 3
MNRRDLLKQIALLTGGVVIGGEVFLSGCKTGAKTELGFTPGNIALLDEVGETILPATATPGAKATQIGEFMKVIVTDCYDEKDQEIFNEGIGLLQDACKKEKGKSFMDCSPQERTGFLIKLDKEAKEYQDKKTAFDENEDIKKKEQMGSGTPEYVKQTMPAHYFTMMKQLTMWGYFTSKEGVTKALHYLPVPGKYIGCTDYKKGDKLQVGLG